MTDAASLAQDAHGSEAIALSKMPRLNCPVHGDRIAMTLEGGTRICPACYIARAQRIAGAIELWTRLGAAGIIVSVCYGPVGGGPPGWSLDILNSKNGEGFARPIRASDLPAAIDLANGVCVERSWISSS